MLSYIFSQISCVDLPFSGSRFTWREKKGGSNNIFERLDRAIGSISWLAKFPQAKVQHHKFTSSDHCCISLAFYNPGITNPLPPPFDLKKCGVPVRIMTI